MMDDQLQICGWARESEIEHRYHDEEWGQLKLDDRTLFEFMVLESAQAGLSWRTVLNKREGYRAHYHNFDPVKVAEFGEVEIERMLKDSGVIRNRAKILSSINNAQIFLSVSDEFDGFSNFLMSFLNGQVITNSWTDLTQIPAKSSFAEQIAKELKIRGISFFGPTIVYAYLQACGYVNDHLLSCPRHNQCKEIAKTLGHQV